MNKIFDTILRHFWVVQSFSPGCVDTSYPNGVRPLVCTVPTLCMPRDPAKAPELDDVPVLSMSGTCEQIPSEQKTSEGSGAAVPAALATISDVRTTGRGGGSKGKAVMLVFCWSFWTMCQLRSKRPSITIHWMKAFILHTRTPGAPV